MQFLDNKSLKFCGYEAFFIEKYDEELAKIETIFLSFPFFDSFLSLLRIAYFFASIWIPYWLKRIFLWICVFL